MNQPNGSATGMTQEEMVRLISQHEVFLNYDIEDKKQLESIVSSRQVKSKETIFGIDDFPDHIFYLLDGALTLNFPDNTKLSIKPGELIGEIGILNGDFRLGRLVAEEDCSLIAICTENLFDANTINPKLGLEIVRRLSKRVTDYLRSKQQVSSREIIRAGENEHVEFKSTLRWNLKADRKDDRIVHAVLKTIAAFLNSDGGVLMIGVADDGGIVGLEHDGFENEDRLLLFLTDVIKSRLGTLHLENIHYDTCKIDGREILRVDVRAGNSPCYFSEEKTDHFYIRTGPSTTDLRLRNVFPYIKKRFA